MAKKSTSKTPSAPAVDRAAAGSPLAQRLCNAVYDLKSACIELSELAGQSCRENYNYEWQTTLLEILEGHPSRIEDSENAVQEWVNELQAEGETRRQVAAMLSSSKTKGARNRVLKRILSEAADDLDE
jgi:hypothetical protein